MRRAILIGSVAALTGAAALVAAVGPDLYRAWRFDAATGRHFASAEAEAGPWPQMETVCAFCHGAGGRSRNAKYPSLAGQPTAYIEGELHAFAAGRRPSPQMDSLAAQLSEDQIRRLAAYYGRQTPETNQVPTSDTALARGGEALVAAKGCAGCHGAALAGGPAAPRLAGQGEAYLAEQLTAFRQGQRQDPTGAMTPVASSLSDAEIKAAAHYIAGPGPAPAG